MHDAQVTALRDRVNAIIDPAVKAEQVDMTTTLKDGRTFHKYIAHAIGSLEVPMTDQQQEGKFIDLADAVLAAAQVRKLIDACWHVEQLPGAAAIVKAAVRRA